MTLLLRCAWARCTWARCTSAAFKQLRRAGRSTSSLTAPREAVEAAESLIERAQAPKAERRSEFAPSCDGGAGIWPHLHHSDLHGDEAASRAETIDAAAAGIHSASGADRGAAADDAAAAEAAAERDGGCALHGESADTQADEEDISASVHYAELLSPKDDAPLAGSAEPPHAGAPAESRAADRTDAAPPPPKPPVEPIDWPHPHPEMHQEVRRTPDAIARFRAHSVVVNAATGTSARAQAGAARARQSGRCAR
jgi:hypothetical protein